METPPKEPLPVKPQLGLWDAVSIIVGIIIGVGIFITPEDIFNMAPGPWEGLAVWALAGLFTLTGALCFAELAGAYPRSGGEYVYLTRAFGPASGFLFAWAQLTVIRTGSITAFAYVFAKYAGSLWQLSQLETTLVATAPIVVLSVVNILGVTFGTRTQNVLTVAKVAGLLGIVAAGLFWGHEEIGPGGQSSAAKVLPVLGTSTVGLVGSPLGQGPLLAASAAIPVRTAAPGWFALAMIFVLWTYSGWHEAAYIVMEVRNRRRNVPLALCLGTAVVMLIYVLVNFAILRGLGFHKAGFSHAVAADVLALGPGNLGARAISVLVMVSALGAINGMIFTSARIYAEMGADHRLFAFLGHWNVRLGTPVRSLVLQGVLSSVLALAVGFGFRDGFTAMVEGTAAVFWLFFLLTGAALIVLRFRDPDLERPFRVPGYPFMPLVFAAGCAYMLYGSVTYAPFLSLIGLAVIAVGVPVYLLSWWRGPHPEERSSARAPAEINVSVRASD